MLELHETLYLGEYHFTCYFNLYVALNKSYTYQELCILLVYIS